MRHRHIAYVGSQDNLGLITSAARPEMRADSLLKIESALGEHFTSFSSALQRFLTEVQRDMKSQ
jgi:hypothetical protein